MTSKVEKNIPPFHRQGNCTPSAAMRWPVLEIGPRLEGHLPGFSAIPDATLLSFSLSPSSRPSRRNCWISASWTVPRSKARSNGPLAWGGSADDTRLRMHDGPVGSQNTSNDRYATEVVLRRFNGSLTMLDARGEDDNADGDATGRAAGGGGHAFDDDLPF